jgi:aminoglycoside phosphotransferase (APT) family kinase protein
MRALPIPVDVADVTPAWLSQVLDRDVAAVEIVDAHSGTTGRARVAVVDGRGDRRALFVKLAPFDERQRRFVDVTGLGVAEARFYRDVARSLPVRMPEVFHAALDDDGRYVMVLEDLAASGCRFPQPDDADVVATVDSLVDELAALHAVHWEDPALTGELAWITAGGRQMFEGGGPYIARAVDHFALDMPPAFTRLGALYVEQTAGVAELFRSGPQTLVHGDAHFGNLFVDGDRAGFFDWAMVMRRTGMWDVAYVLCNSVPVDVRRAHEQAWLDRYRGGLARAGVGIDSSTLWEQYRLLAVYSWASVTSTAGVGDRWQPVEVGQRAMARATTAIEDLESIPLVESLL